MMAAVKKGNAKEFADLITEDPGFKVNGRDGAGRTLLSNACLDGKDFVIPLLLAHPEVDVNAKDKERLTPFMVACIRGHTSCVHLLLKDSRVKVNEPCSKWTPLCRAAEEGHLDIIKLWIASGKEMDLGTPGNDYTDAIGQSKLYGKAAVASLLLRFKSDATRTRSEVREELKINGENTVPFLNFRIPSLFDNSHFRIPCELSAKDHIRPIHNLGQLDERQDYHVS